MKTYYPIQIIDSRFQVDYVTPKEIKPFEEYDENPFITKLYVIIIKHREIKKVSDGNNISGIEDIRDRINDNNFYESFYEKKTIQKMIL